MAVLLVCFSLPDINDPDQLFGHEAQSERVQQEGEHTEHNLRSEEHEKTTSAITGQSCVSTVLQLGLRVPVAAHYRTPAWTRSAAHPQSSSWTFYCGSYREMIRQDGRCFPRSKIIMETNG